MREQGLRRVPNKEQAAISVASKPGKRKRRSNPKLLGIAAHCMLAERKGLEPSASGVTGRRYNRLNYRSVVGSTGLEPVTPAV